MLFSLRKISLELFPIGYMIKLLLCVTQAGEKEQKGELRFKVGKGKCRSFSHAEFMEKRSAEM